MPFTMSVTSASSKLALRRQSFGVLGFATVLVLFSLGMSWVNLDDLAIIDRIEEATINWKQVNATSGDIKWENVPLGGDDRGNGDRPPLSDLLFRVDENRSEIIGNVDWLMNYAIIGVPKTATAEVSRWLDAHPEILGFQPEVRSLYHRRPDELVELLYNLPLGQNYKRGYRSPRDITVGHTADYFRQFWPSTGLIVGVRHPVKWFESWINLRVRMFEKEGFRMNSQSAREIPLRYLGKGLPHQIFYHRHLAMLGKTNSSNDPKQIELLTAVRGRSFPYRSLTRNRVFLYDVSQPFDIDPDHSALFWRDLELFIGLKTPLGPPTSRPYKNPHSTIDICDCLYAALRSDILEVGKAASDWIATYFMDHPDVTISSKERFREMLATWNTDPCFAAGKTEHVQGAEPSQYRPWDSGCSIPTTGKTFETSPTTWESLGQPSLDKLVNGSNVRQGANISFLLQFGIVGFAKTATTYLTRWISSHEDVQMYNQEVHFLTTGRPGLFAKRMYALPAGSQYKRGYKAPNDMTSPLPRFLLHFYFPKTDLILGIRHPIRWFESWYNYNARRGKATANPDVFFYEHPHNLPYQIKFHVALALMGKTKFLESDEEMDLLRPYTDEHLLSTFQGRMEQRVFLYEVSQPFDRNDTRSAAFRRDLSDFLGLSSTLPPVTIRNASKNYHYAINICEDKYIGLRRNLLDFGKAASAWILKHFMELDDVHVSDETRFVELVSTWGFDTCKTFSIKRR